MTKNNTFDCYICGDTYNIVGNAPKLDKGQVMICDNCKKLVENMGYKTETAQ